MEKFQPSKVIARFDVKQLWDSGIRAVLSNFFRTNADKSKTTDSINKLEIDDEYCESGEPSLYCILNTSKGINSTFTMAKLIAQVQLQFSIENSKLKFPKTKIIVFNKSHVCSISSMKIFQNKFISSVL